VPQAVSLSEAIMDAFGQRFGALKLIPSDGGCFEVTIDGTLVYSKLETGDFPENRDVVDQLRKQI
jgi:selenoprotein W-related protein